MLLEASFVKLVFLYSYLAGYKCRMLTPVFWLLCSRLWSPEINSEESIPPAYVAWPASTTNRDVVPARQDGNRFMGSLKGLRIRALSHQAPWLLWICVPKFGVWSHEVCDGCAADAIFWVLDFNDVFLNLCSAASVLHVVKIVLLWGLYCFETKVMMMP